MKPGANSFSFLFFRNQNFKFSKNLKQIRTVWKFTKLSNAVPARSADGA